MTCCIRPECVRIGPGAAGGEGMNHFSARLVEWVHLGESARFRLALPDGGELAGAAMPARPVAEVGADLPACVRPDDVIVLTE